MIELIAAAVSGAVVGDFIREMMFRIERKLSFDLAAWLRHRITDLEYTNLIVTGTLTALRSNCFIPDERGVKVRYSQASVARRVKAETPKEVA